MWKISPYLQRRSAHGGLVSEGKYTQDEQVEQVRRRGYGLSGTVLVPYVHCLRKQKYFRHPRP